MKLCAAASIAFLAPFQVFAGLAWQTQRVQVTARIVDKQATAVFSFRNTGSEPVTITELKASCECTVPQLEKRIYAPGESGKITAVFTFGARVGMQEKTFDIVSDEAGAKPTQLSFGVNILELLTCSPRLFHWRINEAKEEKTATIAAVGAGRIVQVEITEITPAEFTARIDTMEEGKSYRLVMQPKTTSTEGNSKITCIARFADGASQTLVLFCLVR
jgi:hypothetical protein